VALSETATVSYLTSAVFDPARELGLTPRDPDLGIALPIADDDLLLSEKDVAAPSLAEAADRGLLPTWDECRAFYASLSGKD
jgi:dTDP-4-dehydrorhamnose 3,5-epimerase